MGKFKRGGVYYARVKDQRGKWIAKTLNTRDPKVADIRYRELERRAVSPAYRAANETQVHEAFDLFLQSRRVKGCAEVTVQMYSKKLAHVGRLIGHDRPLVQLSDPTLIDGYIASRLDEGASRNTIGKELTALRGMLRTAKRAKKFPYDLDEIFPEEWSTDYVPRTTALTPAQVTALVEWLAAPRTKVDALGRNWRGRADDGARLNQAAFVAFLVATGARLGEGRRAVRGQIDLEKGLVYFAITKTRRKGKREKWVPITPRTRGLLEQVIAATAGRRGALFDPWSNMTRDLEAACEALGIPRVTANDLRRTHANWLVEAGVGTNLVADVLGHVDSRMVEKVYGKLRPEQLRDRILETVH